MVINNGSLLVIIMDHYFILMSVICHPILVPFVIAYYCYLSSLIFCSKGLLKRLVKGHMFKKTFGKALEAGIERWQPNGSEGGHFTKSVFC